MAGNCSSNTGGTNFFELDEILRLEKSESNHMDDSLKLTKLNRFESRIFCDYLQKGVEIIPHVKQT